MGGRYGCFAEHNLHKISVHRSGSLVSCPLKNGATRALRLACEPDRASRSTAAYEPPRRSARRSRAKSRPFAQPPRKVSKSSSLGESHIVAPPAPQQTTSTGRSRARPRRHSAPVTTSSSANDSSTSGQDAFYNAFDLATVARAQTTAPGGDSISRTGKAPLRRETHPAGGRTAPRPLGRPHGG